MAALDVIDLTANCVAHYKMNDNEDDKTIVDSRGFSDGTAQQNTEDLHTTGKVGGALTFNGISDYVNINNTFQTILQSDFSFSCWIKPDDGIPEQDCVFIGTYFTNNDNSVEFAQKGTGRIFFTYIAGSGEGGSVLSQVVFNDGQEIWHYCLVTVEQISSSNIKICIYFDNICILEETMACVMSNYSNPINCFIGAININGESADRFIGCIDNVMIFNKTLSTEEISFLWNNGKGTEELLEITKSSRIVRKIRKNGRFNNGRVFGRY